jgi:Holliday junction resolvase RusA-like endonuclease
MAREGGGVLSDGASPPIVQLTLPAPPSANALFRNTATGRVRTELYDQWLSHAGWRLRAQRPRLVAGPVVILIGVERTNALADIDNRIKPTLDLLVKQHVIEDDRFVIGVAAAWSPSRDGLMRVAIIPAANIAVRFQLADPGHGGWFLEGPSTEEGAI